MKNKIIKIVIWIISWLRSGSLRRKIILPFLSSKFFTFLSLDFLKPPRNKISDNPARSQILFQKIYLKIFRKPEVFLCNFQDTLRVCATYRCNLSCKSCYARGLHDQMPVDMKIDDFKRLIKWSKDKGWKKIRFLGGEATIHPEFIKMLDICYQNQMMVTIPTNNLFPEKILKNLDNRLVKDISINYNAGFMNDKQKNRLFRENIGKLAQRDMPFGFSYVLSYEEDSDNWTDLIKDAERFKPLYIRVSIELPSFSDQSFFAELDPDALFAKVHRMWQMSAKLYIPFFFYRPVLLCMVPQWALDSDYYSGHLFFTCCPISYCSKDSGYGTMVTVNPDLSTFPCASVFIKGPEILSFNDRSEIDLFYREQIKALLLTPLMNKCNYCKYRREFVAAVQKDQAMIDDKGICQAGCANFRCHNSVCFNCKE
ncbi:MAG: radical SAM protein [Candidatus Omnitrophota bacterium]